MKKFLFSLLISLSLFSCVTRKACDRKFPPEKFDSVRIVTNTVTLYKDTTIYVKVPGDTVFNDRIVYVDKKGLCSSKKDTLNTEYATSIAWVFDGILHHKLIQKDKVVQALIKNAIRNTIQQSTLNSKRTIIEKQNYLTSWQWAQVWLGRLFLLILVILIIVIVLTRMFQIPRI